MTESVQIAIIVSTGPTLVGLMGLAVSLINARKIDQVHTVVNSGATEQLRIGMVSALALAAATKLPEHSELAVIASNKYNQSVERSKIR